MGCNCDSSFIDIFLLRENSQNLILNKVKKKRNCGGRGGEMGRILKVTDTKKLALHYSVLRVVITGCLSQERRKGRDQRKLAFRVKCFLVPQVREHRPDQRCHSPLATTGGSNTRGVLYQVHRVGAEPFYFTKPRNYGTIDTSSCVCSSRAPNPISCEIQNANERGVLGILKS